MNSLGDLNKFMCFLFISSQFALMKQIDFGLFCPESPVSSIGGISYNLVAE